MRPRIPSFLAAIAATLVVLASAAAAAQEAVPTDEELVDRPIVRVEIVGLSRVSEQQVRNTIRTAAGNPYDPAAIQADIVDLFRLGDFRTVTARAWLEADGAVGVRFTVEEQPIVNDVQVVGNNLISDQEILAAIPVRPFVPRDEYLVEESQRRIKDLYKERGHFKAEVSIDENALNESNILLFQIIEGPRVKVRAIEFRFVDTQSFPTEQLESQIKTETALFILRKGRLDPKVITEDVAALDAFYRDRGHLDVRIDRMWELSPDDREAKVVFVIDEGRVYTMRNVVAESAAPNRTLLWSSEQYAALIPIKSGDVYSQDLIRKSVREIEDSYARLGYVRDDISVTARQIRVGEQPEVDLFLIIEEGTRSVAGEVIIGGNFLTKEKVVRRHLLFRPGRPLSALDIEESQRRLRQQQLWSAVTITPQPRDAEDPFVRDVLVQVQETNTGSFNFGVAVGSDQGVFGDFSLNQRNFDVADFPESFDELIRQRAFRGAGQKFTLAMQPGNEVSRYSISLTEPYFLDTPISLTGTAYYREWQFDGYDEERVHGSFGVTRRLGQVWSLGANARFERVALNDIDEDSPTAVFDAEGPDNIAGVSLRLTRNTTGTIVRPGRGSVFELAVEQVGLLGGDFDFTSVSGEYTLFLTLDEDFLGRRSILKLNTRAAYIFNGDDAPIYERYYLGGRSFRGFEFRTVSPKGIRNDNGEPSEDPVGGEFLFFAGAQYEFPIFEELFNGVVFLDSGTVSDDFGFNEYRVSVGMGLRLYIAAFGPIPIAFDFGFPILKEGTDEEEIFSFSADIPF
jgi:outer membrane protein insertion porin family